MVHRSGSTLIITPNDGENSQSLPQFLDGLDPCAETTETDNKKSLTTGTATTTLPTKKSSSSESPIKKRRTTTTTTTNAQAKAINTNKIVTNNIKTKQKTNSNNSKGGNNNCNHNNDGTENKDEKLKKKEEEEEEDNNISNLQNKIRSGLRSNSLENISNLQTTDDINSSSLIQYRTRGQQRIKKKRKNENENGYENYGFGKTTTLLKKCVSVESVFINNNVDNDNDHDDDDNNVKEENKRKNNDDKQKQELPLKLTCSVPLDKLTGILDTILMSSQRKYSSHSQPNLTELTTNIDETNTTNNVMTGENTGTDEDNNDNNKKISSLSSSFIDDGNSNVSSSNSNSHTTDSGGVSSHSSQLMKSLCLYCDKKFSSQKVRTKHTERVHAIVRGRRLSSRNSISCPSNLSSYPGCSYCCYNNGSSNNSNSSSNSSNNNNNNNISNSNSNNISNSNNNNSNASNKLNCAISDDLKSLFHHLIEFHSDKYFACKLCAIRFLNTDDLQKHNALKHKIGKIKRKNSIISASATSITTSSSSSSSSSSTIITPITANTSVASVASTTASIIAISNANVSSSSTSSSMSMSTSSSSFVLKRGKGQIISSDSNSDIKITQILHVEIECNNDKNKISNEKEEENNYDPESTPTKTRRQLKQAMENKQLVVTRSCQNILRSDETILSRLGITQNRLPRGRKGIRNRRLVPMESMKNETAQNTIVKTRSKVGRVITTNVVDLPDQTALTRPATSSRTEPLCCTFDDDFYETVSLNVRQNLSCHIDGKLEGDPTSPSPISPVTAVPTIRSTVVKSPLNHDSEIHEATALSTVTAFPTLLTADQYGSDLVGAAKIKRPITKHSWKWKWDCVKKYKYVNEGGKIVKKVKQPMIGLRDLSKLDMWTQLTMRTKHEIARKQFSEMSGTNETLGIGETAREEKRKQIAQLDTILDTRRLPQIVLEQNEQSVIKIEVAEDSNMGGELLSNTVSTLTNFSESTLTAAESTIDNDDNSLPRMLNLIPRKPSESNLNSNIVLSGEWARPRCYICFGCGAKFDKLKSLEEHKMFRHPYVYSTHYEIVGRELIEGDLYKHFYIPTKALNRHKEYKLQMKKCTITTGGEEDSKIGLTENSTCGEESMDSVNSIPASNYTTGTSRSDCETECKAVYTTTSSTKSLTSASSTVSTSVEIEEETRTSVTATTITIGSVASHFSNICTKCKRECGGLLELYRHMLDCSGDYAWFMAKKRKYRYFGSKRRRRDHLRHNARVALQHRKQAAATSTMSTTTTISAVGEGAINKNSNNEETENNNTNRQQKKKCSPAAPRAPRPSDAESIRRMLENLPAKRACRQIIPNVTKPRVKKLGINKKGMLVKKNIKGSNSLKKTRSGGGKNVVKTTVTAITKNMIRNRNRQKKIYTRRLRQLRSRNKEDNINTNVRKQNKGSGSSNSSGGSGNGGTNEKQSENKKESESKSQNVNKSNSGNGNASSTKTNNDDFDRINASSSNKSTNENVVKKLGKKTKCIVEKITQNLQNNKVLLNRHKVTKKNETTSPSSSSAASSDGRKSKVTSGVGGGNSSNNTEKANASNTNVKDDTNSNNGKKYETKKKDEKDNIEPTVTIIEAKKMKKTRALIRRLNFRKSTKQNLMIPTTSSSSSSSSSSSALSSSKTRTTTNINLPLSLLKDNNEKSSKCDNTTTENKNDEVKENTGTTITELNHNENDKTTNSNNCKRINQSTTQNDKDNKDDMKNEEDESSSSVIPSSKKSATTKKKGIKKILNRLKEKNKKSPKHETEQKTTDVTNDESNLNNGDDDTKKEIAESSSSSSSDNSSTSNKSKESLRENYKNEVKNDNSNKEQKQKQKQEDEGEEKEENENNANNKSDSNVPLKIDLPEQQQTLLNVPSQSNGVGGGCGSNQISPSSKRRSKKLNDCIAMLTGKLQEKLGKSFFESNENLDVALSRQSSTTDLNQDPDSSPRQSTEDLSSPVGGGNSNSNSIITIEESPKTTKLDKQPKRKMTCRKIVKNDTNITQDSIPEIVCDTDDTNEDKIKNNSKRLSSSPSPSPSLSSSSLSSSNPNLCLADLTESVIRRSLNADNSRKDFYSSTVSSHELTPLNHQQQTLLNIPRRLRSETQREITTLSSSIPYNSPTSLSAIADLKLQQNTVPSSTSAITATIAETTISLVPFPPKQQTNVSKTSTRRSSAIANRRASIATFNVENPFPFPTPENSLSCSSNLDFDDKNSEILSHSTPKNKRITSTRNTHTSNNNFTAYASDTGSETSSVISEPIDISIVSCKKVVEFEDRNPVKRQKTPEIENIECNPDIDLNLMTPEKDDEFENNKMIDPNELLILSPPIQDISKRNTIGTRRKKIPEHESLIQAINAKNHSFMSMKTSTSMVDPTCTTITPVVSIATSQQPVATFPAPLLPSPIVEIIPSSTNFSAAAIGKCLKKKPIINKTKKVISSDDSILDSINAVISQSCSEPELNKIVDTDKNDFDAFKQNAVQILPKMNDVSENKRQIITRAFKSTEIIPTALPPPPATILPPPKNLTLTSPTATLPPPPPPPSSYLTNVLNPLHFPSLPPPHQLNIPQNITIEMISPKRGQRQSIASSNISIHPDISKRVTHDHDMLPTEAVDLRTCHNNVPKISNYENNYDDDEGPIDLSTKPKDRTNDSPPKSTTTSTSVMLHTSSNISVNAIPNQFSTLQPNTVTNMYNDKMCLRSFETSNTKQIPEQNNILPKDFTNTYATGNQITIIPQLQPQSQHHQPQPPINDKLEIKVLDFSSDPRKDIEAPSVSIELVSVPLPPEQSPKKKAIGRPPKRKSKSPEENKEERLSESLPSSLDNHQTAIDENIISTTENPKENLEIQNLNSSEKSPDSQNSADKLQNNTEQISEVSSENVENSVNSSLGTQEKKKRGGRKKKVANTEVTKEQTQVISKENNQKLDEIKTNCENNETKIIASQDDKISNAKIIENDKNLPVTRKYTRKTAEKLQNQKQSDINRTSESVIDDGKSETAVTLDANDKTNIDLATEDLRDTFTMEEMDNNISICETKFRKNAKFDKKCSQESTTETTTKKNIEKRKSPTVLEDSGKKQSLTENIKYETNDASVQPKRRMTRSKSLAITVAPSFLPKLSNSKGSRQQKQNKNSTEIDSIVASFLTSDSSNEEGLEFAKLRALDGPIRLDGIEKVFEAKNENENDGNDENDCGGTVDEEKNKTTKDSIDGIMDKSSALVNVNSSNIDNNDPEENVNKINESSVEEGIKSKDLLENNSDLPTCQELSISLVKIDEVYNLSKVQTVNIQNNDTNDKNSELEPPKRERSKRIASRRTTLGATVSVELQKTERVIEDVAKEQTVTTAAKRRGRKYPIKENNSILNSTTEVANSSDAIIKSTKDTTENGKNAEKKISSKLIEETICKKSNLKEDTKESVINTDKCTTDTDSVSIENKTTKSVENLTADKSENLSHTENSETLPAASKVIAAAATATGTGTGTGTGTKQRRRRRNELAAIVADQLLESFKEVDKSRIDDLKMLENLAYEKSEDLFITGMRLTPTTKRKVLQEREEKDTNKEAVTAVEKRKSDDNAKKVKVKRSKSQTKNKNDAIDITATAAEEKHNKLSSSIENKSNKDEKDIEKTETIEANTDQMNTTEVSKKRKTSNASNSENNAPPAVSASTLSSSALPHENLFKTFSTKNYNEPLKLNIEPMPQNLNFKICNSSFMRSSQDKDMTNLVGGNNKKNFTPGSTETSNSLDSQSQQSPTQRQDDVNTSTAQRQNQITKLIALNETSSSNEKKSNGSHRKLKKKLSKKKSSNNTGGSSSVVGGIGAGTGKFSSNATNISETENINELRTGLESFTFGKESIMKSSFTGNLFAYDANASSSSNKKNFNSGKNFCLTNKSSTPSLKSSILNTSASSILSPPSSSSIFNFSFSNFAAGSDKETSKNSSKKVTTQSNKKPFLRPSILSNVASEVGTKSMQSQLPLLSNQEHPIVQPITSVETVKPISSRDPRLNKNKLQKRETETTAQISPPLLPTTFEKRRSNPIRQRRKSEISLLTQNSKEFEINEDEIPVLDRLRSSRRLRDARLNSEKPMSTLSKFVTPSVEISDDDEDDVYLNQIAKSVKEKIMTSQQEEDFNEANDGFNVVDPDAIRLLEQPPRPATSMGLSSIPSSNAHDDQSFGGEFGQDDDNTNTELIDMDLDDDISVYTSFSQDVSRLRNKGRFGGRRRRRRSMLFSRRIKKQTNNSNLPEETFDCTICNKTFRKSIALAKHKMTITHIAKLSEHEYLNATKQQNSKESPIVTEAPPPAQEPVPSPLPNVVEDRGNVSEEENSIQIVSPHPDEGENLGSSSDKEFEPIENDNRFSNLELEQAEPEPSVTALEAEPPSVAVLKIPSSGKIGSSSVVNLLNQPGIEPISSPEQMETNYDRYQNTSSRIALSQEERLFYECCNMLKGGETPLVERTYPVIPNSYSAYDVPNKPVTPKSSERFSYLGSDVSGNFQHNTGYTVKSPMSQSRSSPRHAYPKIDINQFSDISSDSNPTATIHHTHPNPPMASSVNFNVGKDHISENKFPFRQESAHELPSAGQPHVGISPFASDVQVLSNRNNYQSSSAYFGNSGNNFALSQFPIRGDSDAGQLQARTFVGSRVGKDNRDNILMPMSYPPEVTTNVTEKPNALGTNRVQSFTSPVHSTSSQGSTVTTTTSRMRTKAAMKGYDNFKVSIPTLGLDMQQALERSPHGGCKLTALAEIALGSEAPVQQPSQTQQHFTPFQQQLEDESINCDKTKANKHDINEKFVKKYHELIINNMKPIKKKDTPSETISPSTKPRRHNSKHNFIDHKFGDKPKDVYDFEDESDNGGEVDAVEECAASSPISRGRDKDSCEEKIIIPERPFKDIGLNEQETIKFHKPEEISTVGTTVALPESATNQNEESIISSTSYSDRDDGFNYGSMSENDDDDENENEKIGENENNKNDSEDDENNENSDDSQSSARTAKTIREKSLIMGRIFKNANKTSRIEERKQEVATVIPEPPPKKKLEVQQQELDKLFDSLRKEPTTTTETTAIKLTNEIGNKRKSTAGNTGDSSSKTAVNKLQSEIPDCKTKDVNNKEQQQTGNTKKRNQKRTTKSTAKISAEKLEKKEDKAKIFLKENGIQKVSHEDTSSKQLIAEDDSLSIATATTTVTKGRRRSRKSDAQQHSKEIYKLQMELGMSAEEIAELIGEGKRKSQRRCAANRPKKFVEIWSSDEYEDFLSTKDIIAFIEEKEKKTKKRKSSAGPKSAERKKDANHLLVESSQSTVALTSKQPQPLATDKLKSIAKEPKSSVEIAKSITDKSQKVTMTEKEPSPISIPPKKPPEKIVDKLLEKLAQTQNASSDQDENKPLSQVIAETKSKSKSVSETESGSSKKIKEKVQEKSGSSLSKEKRCQKRPTLSVKPRIKPHVTAESESDFESDWRRGTFETKRAKIKKRRKTISFKESPVKKQQPNTAKNASTVSTKTAKSSIANQQKKSNNNKSQSENCTAMNMNNDVNGGASGNGGGSSCSGDGGGGGGVVSNSSIGNGGDRKSGGNGATVAHQSKETLGIRPLPRRKRIASEMLYYWSSSSSDEEFGRIETRDDDDDDLTDGEHYQQHGWIVGDSHKKLVTLLAIAKGKKAEDCGVKETNSKKKSS